MVIFKFFFFFKSKTLQLVKLVELVKASSLCQLGEFGDENSALSLATWHQA